MTDPTALHCAALKVLEWPEAYFCPHCNYTIAPDEVDEESFHRRCGWIAEITPPLTRDLVFDLETKLLVTWKDRKDYLQYLYTHIPDDEFQTELGRIVPVSLRKVGLCGDWMARRSTPLGCLRALHKIGILKIEAERNPAKGNP